jgi:ATP-binding cassette subfamily C protein
LLRVRWPYYTAQPVGRFANALSNDATRAAATCRKAAEFLAYSIQTVVYLVIALVNYWQLTLVAFGVGAGIVLVLNSLVRTARRAGQKQTDRTKQFIIYLTDVLNNIRPLKAMGRHRAFTALLDRKNSLLRKALRRQVLSVQTLQVLQAIFMALAIGIGGYVALEYLRLEFGQLLVMGYVIWKLVKNMATVQRHYQNAVLLESPYLALEEIIAETAEAGEELHGGVVPELREGCSLRNVRFGYGGEEVLKGIDLEIPARRITVLSGMSGAGKTTVTDLLLGLYNPASGEVLVDGRPLDQVDLARWRRMIGYVPQELSLLHDTVIANVTLGDPEVSDEQAIAALKMAGAWDFVSTLPDGLKTRVGEKGSQISGGQRQRLALARALAARPKLLVLDEVTSALDRATEEALCATLRELSRDLTILAVSHRPKLIEFADVVYQLADGRAQQVTPADARV